MVRKYNLTTGNFTKVFAGNSRHKTNINGAVDWAFLFVIYIIKRDKVIIAHDNTSMVTISRNLKSPLFTQTLFHGVIALTLSRM